MFRRRIVPACVALLLLLPHLFAAREAKTFFRIGPPRLEGGDEPHYLALLTSLVDDGDLDPANQYAAAREGGPPTGWRYAGRGLGEHTLWFDAQGQRHEWASAFELLHYASDAHGRAVVPRLLPGAQPPVARRYSQHAWGQAVLFAPLLLPLRHTDLIEPGALWLSGLSVVLAFFLFRRLLRAFTDDERAVELCSALAFLGTPVWHYGRSLFTEPLLLLLVVGGYAMWIAHKRAPPAASKSTQAGFALAAGAFLGLALLVKPPAAILAAPILLDALLDAPREGRLRRVALVGLPLALALASVLWMNRAMHGSVFRTVQGWKQGAILPGLLTLFASPDHGLVPFVPLVLVAVPGWILLARHKRRESAVLLSACAAWVLLHAPWERPDGGWCYGPRYLVPVIPFALVGLAGALPLIAEKRWTRRAFQGLCVVSLAMGALGALPYWEFWDEHPLGSLLGQLLH